MRNQSAACAVWIVALLALHGVARASADNDLAIIVNKSGYAITITSNELRAMFLGEKTKWANGNKVAAAILSPERPEFPAILKNIYKMPETEYKSYYLQAEFAGKDIAKPQELPTPDAVKKFVSRTPGAIGVIRASDADDSVRILRVDGAFPGGDDYKLHIVK